MKHCPTIPTNAVQRLLSPVAVLYSLLRDSHAREVLCEKVVAPSIPFVSQALQEHVEVFQRSQERRMLHVHSCSDGAGEAFAFQLWHPEGHRQYFSVCVL